MNNLVAINKLCKSYDNTLVLKDISINIVSGKIVGLLGKNGSGKTTLIKLINDLLEPTSGTILINGKEISPYTKSIISYLPERSYFDPSMKVSEVIDYFCDFYSDFDREKAVRLLGDLNLSTNQVLAKMSKGMREKVRLVLVMSRNASLYILDNL